MTTQAYSVKHYVDLYEYGQYINDLCVGLELELLKTKTVITSGLIQEENLESFNEYAERVQKEIDRCKKEYNRYCYLEYHSAKTIEVSDENSVSFYIWAAERIKAKRTYH